MRQCTLLLLVITILIITLIFQPQSVSADPIGCYRDNGTNRVMSQPKPGVLGMTLEMCRAWCFTDNTNTYYGTQWYFECYCGDKYDTYGRLNDSMCNTTCDGNPQQICGGDKALSVHTVCPRGNHGPDCRDRCGNCKDDTLGCFRINGSCQPSECKPGWIGHHCKTDIDECLRRPCTGKHQGQCKNTPGSYHCKCDRGYEFVKSICQDINECNTGDHKCETDIAKGECVNTEGSYNCTCASGYYLKDGFKCEDINECSNKTWNNDLNKMGVCEHECNNTAGSYQCYCHRGYEPDTGNRAKCKDINECRNATLNLCDPDEGTCLNKEGSYDCNCTNGYRLVYSQFQNDRENTCEDINECTSGTHLCENDKTKGSCENTQGSYLCKCASGYDLIDGKKCEDINECSVQNGGCMHNCTNEQGSFSCSCRSGFLLQSDGKACIDINECRNATLNLCDPDEGTCLNKEGSYDCNCKNGYELVYSQFQNDRENTCEDIDECKRNICGANMNCTNKPGTYKCHCLEGFQSTMENPECTLIPTGSWKIGLAAFLAVLVACGIVVIIILVWRRQQMMSKNMNAYRLTTPSIAVEMKQDNKPTKPTMAAKKKPDRPPKSTSKDHLLDNCSRTDDYDDSCAIYANFTPPSTKPSKTRIKISDMPALIQRVRDKPKALEEEFKKLTERTEESAAFAEQKDLKSKNRYKNIVPYDYNRVTLNQLGKDTKTTYINASFVQGYNDNRKFIASHGPISTTIDDFWRMVWEYKVSIIVMVTKCKEDLKMKCEQYWPEDSVPQTLDVGISIKLCSAHYRTDHVQRKFSLTKDEEERSLVHLQYTAWPDHGVPPHSISLISLRDKVRSLVKNGDNAPVVVHCSAGVGRTGTYIGLDSLLDEAQELGEIDIHDTVLTLRKQRMNSVQTLDQYTFLFKAVYEGLIMGTTRTSTSQIQNKVSALNSIHPITGKRVLETEFNMICEMQPMYTEEQCSDALTPVNIKKNRNQNIVPPNCQRVFISNGEQSDYINAVFVPSPDRPDSYIATQFPMSHTLGDFWSMCLDHDCAVVVILCRDGQDDDAVLTLLPQTDDWFTFGQLSVGGTQQLQQPQTAEWSSCCEQYEVTVRKSAFDQEAAIYENTKAASKQKTTENGEEDKEVKVTVLVTSLSKSVSSMNESLLRISREVTSIQDKNSDKERPVVVTCSTGISLCGPYIASSNCLSMIQSDDAVDVVQIVLDLKKSQPHFISTKDDYQQVYKIAELCASQTATYANLL